MRRLYLCCAVLSLGVFAGTASAGIANFDDLPVDSYGFEFTTGGITFSDYHSEADETAGPGEFVVDAIDNDQFLGPGGDGEGLASYPNVLTAWVHSSSGCCYSRFGSLTMSTGGIETFGSIDVFVFCPRIFAPPPTTLVLEATLDGVVVAEDRAFTHDVAGETVHYPLSVSGVEYDTLRLYGDPGDFICVMDNVVMTPEPTTLAMLAGCALLALRRRR